VTSAGPAHSRRLAAPPSRVPAPRPAPVPAGSQGLQALPRPATTVRAVRRL